MKIISREITEDERKYIYDDFVDIEIGLGISQAERVRYSYVARENGDVVGYASGIISYKWFVLSNMWVKAEHRRNRIGTKLLCMLEEKIKAAGARHVYTWMTSPDNENDFVWTIGHGNEHFYEKMGYRSYTVIENFFDVEGIHHVGYRKDLLKFNDISLNDAGGNVCITNNEITQDEFRRIGELVKQERLNLFPQREQVKYSYVIENNGGVIGYVAGFTNYKWFVLTDMWTKREYRRQGLGSKLLLFLEEQVKAAGVRHMYTWTMGRDNAQYYESLGYKCFTVLEDFFDVEGISHIGYRKDF